MELILTVGLPRSGKTTWAKQQGLPIVNPDSIRLALHGQRFIPAAEPMVWALAKYMVCSLFLAGHARVILDATNTTDKRRQEWYAEALAHGYTVSLQIIDTPAEVCLARAAAEGDTAIVPIIEKMAAQWDLDPLPTNVPVAPASRYGYCPVCGAIGIVRERRPDGNDTCARGHQYPSAQALTEQPVAC